MAAFNWKYIYKYISNFYLLHATNPTRLFLLCKSYKEISSLLEFEQSSKGEKNSAAFHSAFYFYVFKHFILIFCFSWHNPCKYLLIITKDKSLFNNGYLLLFHHHCYQYNLFIKASKLNRNIVLKKNQFIYTYICKLN